MKRCSDCGLKKSITEFSFRKKNEGLRQSRCKECFKPFLRNYQFVRKYGITVVDYEKMFTEQKGRCKLCGRTAKQLIKAGVKDVLVIDHNHKTGRVRALLCTGCNVALGRFGDDPKKLERAAKYLRSHGG